MLNRPDEDSHENSRSIQVVNKNDDDHNHGAVGKESDSPPGGWRQDRTVADNASANVTAPIEIIFSPSASSPTVRRDRISEYERASLIKSKRSVNGPGFTVVPKSDRGGYSSLSMTEFPNGEWNTKMSV